VRQVGYLQELMDQALAYWKLLEDIHIIDIIRK
jgi:hypothetical protein